MHAISVLSIVLHTALPNLLCYTVHCGSGAVCVHLSCWYWLLIQCFIDLYSYFHEHIHEQDNYDINMGKGYDNSGL